MMELFSRNDVGQAYDLAAGAKDRMGVTLGRPTNDNIDVVLRAHA
jgi:hypothetical protein